MTTPAKTTGPKTAAGLEGVVALESRICEIDGSAGKLSYSGYGIDDLARNSTYEEVVHLLWFGDLPTAQELQELVSALGRNRAIPAQVMRILDSASPKTSPMALLRTATSALGQLDPEAEDPCDQANLRKAIRLAAQLPTIVAAVARIQRGRNPVEPRSDLDTAANFLYMIHGELPGPEAHRVFDACLILHAEHGLNASTFAARVIAATMADMYGAVTGAIGALQGPLHGGANLKVKEMLDQIRASGVSPEAWVTDALQRKERIMGFGHRVYKTLDPRARFLQEMLGALSRERGDTSWYDLSNTIMGMMEREKGLYPNVDFFSASVYALLDIDGPLFTPIFAMSRISGWTAHLMEQWQDNRLIRPRAAYVGPAPRSTR